MSPKHPLGDIVLLNLIPARFINDISDEKSLFLVGFVMVNLSVSVFTRLFGPL